MDIRDIKARIELAYRRLESLKKDKSRAASFERDMHSHDIKLLTEILNKKDPCDFFSIEAAKGGEK